VKMLVCLLVLSFTLGGCARKAPFHAEYAELIREAKTPREKLLHTLDYRLLCYTERNELEQHLVLSDGIDQFEAWMLAKVFISENIGACNDLEPPEMTAGQWRIRYRLGREPKDGPPIHVDTKSGRITCAGYPTIENPTGFLVQYRARFEEPKKRD
jgi:hypothetical protein